MLERRLQWQLLVVQICLLLLLSKAMAAWSIGMFALLMLTKAAQLQRQWSGWRNRHVNTVALFFLVAIALFGRSLGVMNIMIHLLLLSAVLRLLTLPSKQRADWLQVLWVHYFLLACGFLLHQVIWLALAIITVGLLNLRCQYLWFAGKILPINWRKAVLTSLACIATVTLLFIFFPRLAPFWQLPGSNVSKSGLSDQMAPGEVASLLQSDELAFRVAFDGVKPAATELYFRAKVYQDFDGVRWRARQARPAEANMRSSADMLADTPPDWHYRVIVEPHQQHHLFSLGLSLPRSDRSRLGNDWLLWQPALVAQRVSYQAVGYARPLPDTTTTPDYLQLPAGNPQSRQLALSLQAQMTEPNAEGMVQLISRYLQQQPFRYSLSPGEMSGEQIDQFLFERQQGFCAHYAQATIFLLRAAGFPARMVGGYLGGRWQDDGQYLQVSQADAHAWVEYLKDSHWHRFDPTALIAPELLSRNQTFNTAGAGGAAQATWMRLQLMVMLPLQHLDYYWSAWVLSFDRTTQRQWLQQLQQWRAAMDTTFVTFLLLLLSLPLSVLLIWRYLHRQQQADSLQLLAPLTKRWPKTPNCSVTEYLTQIAQQQPLAAQQLQALAQLYQRWQFNDEKKLQRKIDAQVRQVIRVVKRGS